MRVLFAHGWGFDAGFWRPLRAALGDPAGAAEDRGYFGTPHAAVVSGSYIAVCHSLGTLRHAELVSASTAQQEQLASLGPRWTPEHVRGDDGEVGCIGIVAINGFDRFCGSPGVAPRVVDRMIARLAREPEDTVRDFRSRCGDDTPIGGVDPGPLRADLLHLRDGDARGRPTPPLLVLHGGRDPILSPAHRAATFAGHDHDTHPEAGHLLPLTHPGWCAQRIVAWLRR